MLQVVYVMPFNDSRKYPCRQPFFFFRSSSFVFVHVQSPPALSGFGCG